MSGEALRSKTTTIWLTLAFLQSLGSSQVSKLDWKIWLSKGAISFAHSFKTVFEIMSGPHAFFVLMVASLEQATGLQIFFKIGGPK